MVVIHNYLKIRFLPEEKNGDQNRVTGLELRHYQWRIIQAMVLYPYPKYLEQAETTKKILK